MHQTEPVAGEQDRGERGPHSFKVGFHFDLRGDSRVAGSDRGVKLGQQIAAGLVVIEMGQRGDHQLGGHLAGCVAAHAVGQGQQACTGVNGVFVIGTYQAAIASGGIAQDQGHERHSPRVTGATRLPSCRSEPAFLVELVPQWSPSPCQGKCRWSILDLRHTIPNRA
ncbi:hypothetical protein MSIMFI_01267 [Mycobacterium simulans]|nr:hypothetical protein MSIMFI_01267 [Mycobacterium simulans]